MSLKNILIKNFLTYKLYLYYNLYIRNKGYRKREKYSQWGEDTFIKNFFKNKNKGFYVDIGCIHPIMYSNTCLLHNNGWSGVNIDLNQTSIDLFKIARPNDYNICSAISNQVEECDLYFDHNFSPVNTLEKKFYESSDKKKAFKKLVKRRITTQTFDLIIKNISDLPKINFLNIDCEGYDFTALESFNIKKYMPDLVCMETHDAKGVAVSEYEKILNLFKINNYVLIERFGASSFFKSNIQQGHDQKV